MSGLVSIASASFGTRLPVHSFVYIIYLLQVWCSLTCGRYGTVPIFLCQICFPFTSAKFGVYLHVAGLVPIYLCQTLCVFTCDQLGAHLLVQGLMPCLITCGRCGAHLRLLGSVPI